MGDTPRSPSDLPLVWTLSPRDLMPLPRDMPLMPTTDTDTTDSSTERGPLTLTLSTDTDTPPLSPSDLPLVWTPSPRDLTLPPRDTLLMPTTDTDSSMERGPLMLTLTTDSDTPLFPSDPPLVWTPSPRDWMPLPRDTLLMLTMDTDTTDSC